MKSVFDQNNIALEESMLGFQDRALTNAKLKAISDINDITKQLPGSQMKFRNAIMTHGKLAKTDTMQNRLINLKIKYNAKLH
jgi:hypothetical protein